MSDFISSAMRKHIEAYKSETRPLSSEEFNELFAMKEPIILPFEMRIRETPHVFTPERKDHLFDRHLLARVLIANASGDSIMLVGEKATGKTSFVKQFHQRLNNPLFVINGGPGLDEDTLIGRPTPVQTDDGIVLRDMAGRLMYGLKWGIPVCIDEISTIEDRVLYACNDILSGEQVVPLKQMVMDPDIEPSKLSEDKHGLIVRHPKFRFWATDNTGGRADADSNYGHATIINAATRSRMTSFDVPFLPKAMEVEIIKTFLLGHNKLVTKNKSEALHIIQKLHIEQMVDFAIMFRDAYAGRNSQVMTADTISMRELLRWASQSVWYESLDHAFNDSIMGNLTDSDRGVAKLFFEEIFQRPLNLSIPLFVSDGTF